MAGGLGTLHIRDDIGRLVSIGVPGVRSITDVAERNLCLGCGVCAYIQPNDIEMVDDLDAGRRPLVQIGSGPPDTSEALRACPGAELAHPSAAPDGAVPELLSEWGPVLEVWEGYAGDEDIRFAGSSGGAATALALHALRKEGMHGVLHIAARPDIPYLNETVLSRTRDELLAATGSRYAPASPCDGLQLVEDAPAPCVFIGKPCDVAGAQRAAAVRPALSQRLGLTIGIFCAGTPSYRGTMEMMRQMGVADAEQIRSVRYRGNGWPGRATVVADDPDAQSGTVTYDMSYEESWGRILQRHRQWRCYVCPDHTGEFADIAVGDPWYREIGPGEVGQSLVVVRTERGRRIVRNAIAADAITLRRVDAALLPASQPNLQQTRGAVWGRTTVTRALGVPTPRFRNLPTLPAWRRRLTAKQKAQSIYGTLKRVVTKRLYRRRPVRPYRTSAN